MTRDFTNNSGATINVQEAGLYCQHETVAFGNPRFLMARDLFVVNIPNANTLTLNYRIRTVTGATGGFTRWFLEMMFRQFTLLNRDTTDVFGGTQTKAFELGQFMTVGMGGTNQQSPFLGGVQGQFYGPQVGTDNTAMDINQFQMGARIPHGTGTDEMLIYGGFVQNYVQSASDASFDIVRIFQNESGAAITINEVGIFSGVAEASDLEPPSMIVRDVPAAGTVVNDNEIIRVTYTIRVQE